MNKATIKGTVHTKMRNLDQIYKITIVVFKAIWSNQKYLIASKNNDDNEDLESLISHLGQIFSTKCQACFSCLEFGSVKVNKGM